MTQDSMLGQPLPAPVAHAAASAQLGALQRVYEPKRAGWFQLVFLFLIGLLCTVILLGFYIIWLLFRTPNLSRSRAAQRVYLFERGFVLAERPDAPQVFRFDGIDTVFQKIVSQRTYGIETARNYLYTITARDGRQVKLTQFWAGIDELGPTINNRVSSALLPATLGAVERGQAVQFGDITMNASGISGRRKSVTWQEVRQVRIANGYVSVDIAGRFFSLSTTAAANLPNLPLFLELTDRLRANAAR
jgi:hypothetical protein